MRFWGSMNWPTIEPETIPFLALRGIQFNKQKYDLWLSNLTPFKYLEHIMRDDIHKVRFGIMGYMFCTELHIHRRDDLKGSWHERTTNKGEISESSTPKDLDLEYEFHMDKLLRESFLRFYWVSTGGQNLTASSYNAT